MMVIGLVVVAGLVMLGVLALVSHYGTTSYKPRGKGVSEVKKRPSDGVAWVIGRAEGLMVLYDPENPEALIELYCLGEKPIFMDPSEALKLERIELIRRAGGGWFVPIIAKLAAGERVEEAEIEEAYRDAVGGTPKRFHRSSGD